MTVKNLFTGRTTAETAIDRIRNFEQFAIDMHPDGYYVAFSGGKDSIVLLDLVRRAGVRHTTHMSLTTVDPPELLHYLRDHYPDVTRERPDRGMFGLIRKKLMLPNATARWCCEYLKETGGDGRYVVTGIRWEESYRRRNRRMTETCMRGKRRRLLHPIIDWTTSDVWEYIRTRELPYCRLYDEGFDRIGCVGCPLASWRIRIKHFERWPRFRRAYIRACQYVVDNKPDCSWATGEEMFAWWNSYAVRHKGGNPPDVLFGG